MTLILRSAPALTLLAIALGASQARAQAYNPNDPLAVIYSVYNPEVTDHFLTQAPAEAQWALANGWSATGDAIYLERTQQPNTVPLRRFYKWLPQREHFYTTRPADIAAVIDLGYTDEGTVGYAYSMQVPGSTPLYRLVKFWGETGDLVHRYTVEESTRQALVADGYVDEGVEGYVYKTAVPTVPGGHIFGHRFDTTICGGANAANYRDCFFGSFRAENGPPRPPGATRQTIRFNFTSPDMFGSGEHLVITPRGVLVANFQDLKRGHLEGLGLVIGASYFGCVAPDRTFIEQWWPEVGPNANWNSYNYTTATGPDSCGALDLANDRTYFVTISVDDTGIARYVVALGPFLISAGEARWSSMAWKRLLPPFRPEVETFFLTNAQGAIRDYTAYITNLHVSWD